ncbi:MAG TPA: MFS transporter, partial [Chloroflexota bacterium]|nr:MFS transporter [Chloroflexota bacterium]
TYWPSGALEPIRAGLGLSYTEISLAIASLSAGGLLGHLFQIAADFVDRRLLATLGALGYAAGMLTFGLGRSLEALVIGGFVWGASSDAFVHGCEVTLVDLCGDDLPVVLGRVNAYGAAGDLLGPLTLAATLALGWPWRTLFLVGGALMVLYAAVVALQRFPERKIEPPEPPVAAMLSVIRDPRVLLLAAIDGLFALLDEPLLGFLNAFLTRVRDWPPAAATVLISLMVLAGLCGFLAVPVFSERVASRRLRAVFASALAVSLIVLVLAPAVWLEVAAGLGFGFSGAVFYSVLEAAYLGLRPGQAGTTGAAVSIIGLAGIGFPTLVGAVTDHHGLATGVAVYAVVPIAILALLVAERIVAGTGPSPTPRGPCVADPRPWSLPGGPRQ